jgi:hypothetical protein
VSLKSLTEAKKADIMTMSPNMPRSASNGESPAFFANNCACAAGPPSIGLALRGLTTYALVARPLR